MVKHLRGRMKATELFAVYRPLLLIDCGYEVFIIVISLVALNKNRNNFGLELYRFSKRLRDDRD